MNLSYTGVKDTFRFIQDVLNALEDVVYFNIDVKRETNVKRKFKLILHVFLRVVIFHLKSLNELSKFLS